jgi:hypothetical protein
VTADRDQQIAELRETLRWARVVGTCGECRHWVPNDGVTEHGQCVRFQQEPGAVLDQRLATLPAFTLYRIGERHAFFCLPTFGCALHEPHEPDSEAAQARSEGQ